MGRKKRNQWDPQAEIVLETTAGYKSRQRPVTFLINGSFAPRTRTDKKERYRLIEEENKHLREENASLKEEKESLKEELIIYKEEQNKFQQISTEHAAKLFQIQNNEHVQVQIGDHNLQVSNHFDPTFLEDLFKRYEDKIDQSESQRTSMEKEIRRLSSRIEELTKAQKRSGQMFDNLEMPHRFQELYKLTDNEQACPVVSFREMTEQIADVMQNLTPEVIRLQDSIKSLNSLVDEPKLEILSVLCSAQRSMSTMSLHEQNHKHIANQFHLERRIRSEININTHV